MGKLEVGCWIDADRRVEKLVAVFSFVENTNKNVYSN